MTSNPLNKLIWEKLQDIVGWNISPDSLISNLPLDQLFIETCEQEFSMTVRNKHHPIILSDIKSWKNGKTMANLAYEIDAQYQHNYFNAENGTSVTGVIGEVLDINNNPLTNKWNIRGDALVARIMHMQEHNPLLKILDMGCGVNAYKHRLANVTGVDPYRAEADIISTQKNFNPGNEKWDIILCFGPMNWYTYDEQYLNMCKLKECLSPTGVIFWSHVHNYEQIFQKDSHLSRTWIHGSAETAHRNSSFFYYDRLWKYVWYFNWTEHSIKVLTDHCGLEIQQIDYDHCNLYRPPVYRMFLEICHKTESGVDV